MTEERRRGEPQAVGVTFRCDARLLDAVEDEAGREGYDRSAMIRTLLREALQGRYMVRGSTEASEGDAG